MSYKALYRTYRPQVFNDVTGQEVVVKTLQNAIKNNKISHAYLFSGPRGTGKTSIARIFAKALNCSNLQVNEPCDECVSCREISQGINPDVIEIDAASNNGVDEIRDIREKVKFLPSGSKYKIYIIDEVHMLSGGAFNALLKTLEEPPKHVVFILATTEPQKLPATIISRCQRYEFKALNINEINDRLKKICEVEGVSITDEALNSISESAEGAMRDALSILDQAISYGNKNIDIEDINGVTGSLSFEKIITLVSSIENKDIHGTLEQFNDLISNGKEVSKIINSLLIFYRDVLLYKSVGDSGFSKYIFSKELFKGYCNNVVISKIMYYIDALSEVQGKVKYSTTPNIFLEIALIKMCNISVEDLDVLKRLTTLEEKVNNLDLSDLSSELNVNNVNSIDNEKVNTIELRVNQIINELNRLEIRKQLEKVDYLYNNINDFKESIKQIDSKNISSEIQVLQDKIAEIELFVNMEENNSQVNNLNLNEYDSWNNKIKELDAKINALTEEKHENCDIDLTAIYERINKIESQENNLDLNDLQATIRGMVDDINQIKEKLVDEENKEYEVSVENNNITEISEKLMFLEKRVYQIVAGELSHIKVSKKDTKKNVGQIMLFGDEVLGIDDFESSKENYDFGQLQKETNAITEETKVDDIVDNKENIIEETNVIENGDNNVDENVSDFSIENIISNDAIVEEVKEKKSEHNENLGLFETNSFITPKHSEDNKQDIPVSKYFDFERGQEVTNKENSTLVITEKKTDELGSNLEKDIISLEKETTKNLTTEKEEEVVEEKVVTKEKELKDKFATYNIKYIEQILHDSRSIEAKNDKVRIEQVWKTMTRGAKPEQFSIIETLQEGKVTVVGNKEFIIAFSNVSLCNIVMRRKFKDSAIRILYNLLGDTYDYIALPIDVWSQKSSEYKGQYQIGIKYPTLTPINIEGLEIANDDEEYQTENDKTISRTIKLFGEENVEIE